jgi:hypothetical protein
MPESESKAECLVVVWDHQVSLEGQWTDPVWTEVRRALDVPPKKKSSTYRLGFNEYLDDLWLQKLRQEERDQSWLLHPMVYPYKSGDLLILGSKPHRVALFHSKVRLNTGGPSMPALRAMRDLLNDLAPELVLSVGLGGGAKATDVAGDVVLSSKASFDLPGELATSSLQRQTFGGRWTPDPTWFQELELEPREEPSLVAPSLNYEAPSVSLRPLTAREPHVLVRDRPVLTMPRLSAHGFVIPAPAGSGSIGARGGAVDMDAAALAYACGQGIDFGAVVGVAVPPIRRLTEDLEGRLRIGWAELFLKAHAQQAARNAALVVRRICDVRAVDSGS